MKIEYRRTSDLVPYKNNPRKNDEAAKLVAESIKAFGFKVPIIVDTAGVIVAGHTRLKASELLGMSEVPVIVADDLTEEQVRAFRLADNKVAEAASWDDEILGFELSKILDFEMADFGFEQGGDHFWELDGETNEEYEAFVDKFKPKLTTDDCYTPEPVYNAIMDWAVREYGLEGRQIIRPFYPGGDYRNEDYPDGCVVIDNPPFSIESEIVRFYYEQGIDFFLFCPSLTTFGCSRDTDASFVCVGADITYENGAEVKTSFVTSLSEYRVDTAPELIGIVEDAQTEETVQMPSYEYPGEVLTSSAAARLAKYGQRLRIKKSDCQFLRRLDAQAEEGKAIYGGGMLLSKRAAAERAAAEQKAAEQKAAEQKMGRVWRLSEREKKIIEEMEERHGG